MLVEHLQAGGAPAGRRPPRGALTLTATADRLLVVAGIYWALSANRGFFRAALSGRALDDPGTWGFAATLALGLGALHVLLLAPLANRWTVRPLLALLIVATAFASWFMQAYGVYLDPAMLRNVLRTDAAEAGELLSLRLAWHLAVEAGLPLWLLWRVRVVARPWRDALARRVVLIVLAAAALAGSVLANFQPLASLIREHREVRYLVTPANYLWSLASVVRSDVRGAAQPRQAIGLDARPGASWGPRARPRVVVLVVGETARAANWGLAGYARQTTPQLAALPEWVNFAEVAACGTNTEVSLPCLFAPLGRRDYDEARIRASESLLHVLARAGVGVHWRDNQSGCKGVCAGLPNDTVSARETPGLCDDRRCLDEALLHDLDTRLEAARGTQLWVLHMLGNHGPAYFRRYPPAFARFEPACREDDLRLCSREQIVNAYDNALLYTDEVLARLVAQLRARAGRVDSAVVFVSDHGESLGENGLFLHGLPYAIAPDVQKKVPMGIWASAGFTAAAGLDTGCLRRRAAEPASHDHLFHTLLGLLDVQTSLYEPAWDLSSGCRVAP